MANSDILEFSNDGKTVIDVYDKSVKSITIPDGVTEIGKSAFYGCSSLQSINVSKDNKHFASVDGILFNKDLTIIVRFPEQYDVTEYVIPNSVTEIGDSAFYDCRSLQSIDIPNSVTVIGDRAFSDCSSLQSIDVSNDNMHFASVDGILFNKDLTAIVRFPPKYDVNEYVIPNSVTKIGRGAFDGCSSLQSIDIPNSVTVIGDSAFWNCSSLQSIDIPNSVTEIGSCAFYDCSSLQSIVIPNGVTEIGNGAFEYCSSLQSIVIPDSVTKIGHSAFAYCHSLQSIDIPNSVTVIGNDAFRHCSSLQSIDIPDSVTKIGDDAFYGCSSLQSINVSKDNKHFASVNGILFNKDLTIIVRFPPKNDIKEYVIPNSVTKIEECAFDDCSSLQSIDIPNSVTKIGNGAFRGCSSLQSIVIPDSVIKIGWRAFEYCKSLQSIDIPDSVTEIEEYAFDGCSSLQSIVIPDSVTKIGHSAFAYCYSLEHIYLHCNNVEKLEVSKDIFEGVDFHKCILHVPSGKSWAYRRHDVFIHFFNIVTMGVNS